MRWTWLGTTMVLTLAGCGEDSGAAAGGDYTQVGDVSLDGAVGDATGGADAEDGAAGLEDGQASDAAATDDAGSPDGGDTQADASPAKYPDCLSLIGCVAQGCGMVNWTAGCAAACVSGASPAVAAAYAGVESCIQTSCRDGLCKGSSDPKCVGQCVGEKCMTKISVCGADGKSGTASCGSYFSCAQACGADKNPLACVSGCYGAMSGKAQAQFQALDACNAAAGGADTFAACPEQVLTCISDGASGSKTCLDALSCSAGCSTGTDAQKAACMSSCWGQTAPAAQTEFAAAMKCMSANKSGCADAMMTCTKPSGTATCMAAITCMQACKQTDPQAKAGCIYGCLHAASPSEAKKNFELQVCIGQCNCAGNSACDQQCLAGPCKAAFQTCQGP